MDACEVLLGRPWQFDRKTIHDGESNVYKVRVRGKTKTLLPLPPSKVAEKMEKTKTQEVLIASRKQVTKTLQDNRVIWVLLTKELADEGLKLISDINDPTLQQLVRKYEDVFPAELPLGLPPLRGIEHQIDLIPGAAVPNKAPYRCNPEETKELQRHIDELMQ